MNNENWTKGEWEWILPDDSEVDCDVGKLVCGDVVIMDFGNDEQYYPTAGFIPEKPDRDLIESSNDLYEALKDAEQLLREVAKVSGLTHSDAESCADTALKALAKARGDS